MENRPWVQHVEFLILMVTMIGGVYAIDGKIERQVDSQTARTDKLYEVFIELIKETK